MDQDSWILLGAFVIIAVALLVYLSLTGTIDIDWNAIFNIKTYSKD